MRRRTLLAAAAALPLSSLACRRDRVREFGFDGRLAGPGMDLGHQVRDRALSRATQFRDVDVVIAGAGVAGLNAAWRLEDSGLDHVILEPEPDPGGTSRWGATPVSEHPCAAHYVPAPTKALGPLVKLLEEAGSIEGYTAAGEPIFAEHHLVRAPEERIFQEGQWWEGLYLHTGSTPEEIRQYRAFFQEVDRWSAWKDAGGRRAFDLPRSRGSRDPQVQALDAMSFERWLDERGLTSRRLRWFLDYACRDDYGAHLAQTSAWAGLFYFAARKQGPGEDSRPLLTWPEGNGFLVKALLKHCQGRLRLGQGVHRIVPLPDGRLEVHAWDAAGNRAVGWRARRVIFAAPMLLVPRVMPEAAEARPDVYTQFVPSSWLVANLTLKDRPKEKGFPLAWDNVIRDSPGLGYVVATHQRCVDHGPSVWTYYRAFASPDPRQDWHRLLAMDWRACARMVLQDLQGVHPGLDKLITRMDVFRWAHAMVRPRPGLLFHPAMEAAREPFKGVHFAHTDLSGFALFEEAQDHGLRAAEEVLAGLGKAGRSWRG